METIKLNITNMISPHCQMTVRNAVGNLKGTEIKSIEPGEAVINVNTSEIETAQVIKTIEQAGYRIESKTYVQSN